MVTKYQTYFEKKSFYLVKKKKNEIDILEYKIVWERPFFGAILDTPLRTLISDVINGRSLIQFCKTEVEI